MKKLRIIVKKKNQKTYKEIQNFLLDLRALTGDTADSYDLKQLQQTASSLIPFCAYYKLEDVIQYLTIKFKANINYKSILPLSNPFTITALMESANSNNILLARLVLNLDAKTLDTIDDRNRSALMYAALNGHKLMVTMLLQYGSQDSLKTLDHLCKRNGLYCTTSNSLLYILGQLILHIPVPAKDKYGIKALRAYKNDLHQAFDKNYNRHPTQQRYSSNKSTALRLFKSHALAIASFLQNHRQVKNILHNHHWLIHSTSAGKQALDYAIQNNDTAMVQQLLKAGVNAKSFSSHVHSCSPEINAILNKHKFFEHILEKNWKPKERPKLTICFKTRLLPIIKNNNILGICLNTVKCRSTK